MSLVVVHPTAEGSGVELPFETVCKCFDVLAAADADRHKRPAKLKRLWDVYGLRTHPLFELMRLILPQVSDSRRTQACGGARLRIVSALSPPQLDTLRPQYRLKHKALAKM